MLDIEIKTKSNIELENHIYNSSLNYTRINIIDWMYRCMPMMIYLMDVPVEKVEAAFRTIINNSKLDKDLVMWLNNNLDVVIKRHYDILCKSDPRIRKGVV